MFGSAGAPALRLEVISVDASAFFLFGFSDVRVLDLVIVSFRDVRVDCLLLGVTVHHEAIGLFISIYIKKHVSLLTILVHSIFLCSLLSILFSDSFPVPDQIEEDGHDEGDLSEQFQNRELVFILALTNCNVVDPQDRDREQNCALLEDGILVLDNLHAQVSLKCIDKHQSKHEPVERRLLVDILKVQVESICIAAHSIANERKDVVAQKQKD